MPVGVVAGQPRTFQPEHDPGPAEGDVGNQALEPGPVGRARAGLALIVVDHDDPLGRPAERDSTPAQVVLTPRRLGVVGDLVEGGLAHVEVGIAAQVLRGDLARVDHDRLLSVRWVGLFQQ